MFGEYVLVVNKIIVVYKFVVNMSKTKDKSGTGTEAGEPLLDESEKTAVVINATDESRNKLHPPEVKRNKSEYNRF